MINKSSVYDLAREIGAVWLIWLYLVSSWLLIFSSYLLLLQFLLPWLVVWSLESYLLDLAAFNSLWICNVFSSDQCVLGRGLTIWESGILVLFDLGFFFKRACSYLNLPRWVLQNWAESRLSVGSFNSLLKSFVSNDFANLVLQIMNC